MADPTSAPVPTSRKRKRALAIIAAVVVAGGLAWGTYYALVASRYESTDNAYVQGNVIQITPQTGGTVISIGADEMQLVRAGQPLVRLDPADARVALEQSEAELARTVRQVRGVFVNSATLADQVRVREAEVDKARTEVARAEADAARRKALEESGAVGKEENDHAASQLQSARSALTAAQSALQAARDQLAANQALIDHTSVTRHPEVERAAARVREASLALQRSVLPAPSDGFIAHRAVQIGQRVQPGAALMTMVALDRVWIDANFKEGQLRSIRLGQPATAVADVYGRKVEYHGTVAGLGAGTGAAFALLPAQNATGNWIKIVQRVPVRIELDRRELAAHPLRVGLSMDVTVDVSRKDGKMLPDAPASGVTAETAVFDGSHERSDVLVRDIIEANLGGPAAGEPADGRKAPFHAAGARADRSLQ